MDANLESSGATPLPPDLIEAVRGAQAKQAEDLRIFDLRGVTSLTEFFLLAVEPISARTRRFRTRSCGVLRKSKVDLDFPSGSRVTRKPIDSDGLRRLHRPHFPARPASITIWSGCGVRPKSARCRRKRFPRRWHPARLPDHVERMPLPESGREFFRRFEEGAPLPLQFPFPIEDASVRIRPLARETPVLESEKLNEHASASLFLRRRISRRADPSARGAANFVRQIPRDDLPAGVVAFSSGNMRRRWLSRPVMRVRAPPSSCLRTPRA